MATPTLKPTSAPPTTSSPQIPDGPARARVGPTTPPGAAVPPFAARQDIGPLSSKDDKDYWMEWPEEEPEA